MGGAKTMKIKLLLVGVGLMLSITATAHAWNVHVINKSKYEIIVELGGHHFFWLNHAEWTVKIPPNAESDINTGLICPIGYRVDFINCPHPDKGIDKRGNVWTASCRNSTITVHDENIASWQ